MTPFTVDHLTFHYQEKLEELRRAYSERYYCVNGSWRIWTNTGWQNSAADVALTEDQVITVSFFSDMQIFCAMSYTYFCPDYDHWTAYHASEWDGEQATIVRNYSQVNFRQFVRDHIGGAMVDGENAGFRYAIDREIVDGAMQPDVQTGDVVDDEIDPLLPTDDIFAAHHIFGEWLFDDLHAFLSCLTATAGECSGVYGSPVERSAYGSAADSSSNSSGHVWLGWTTTDDSDDVLTALVAEAKTNLATPTESTGFRKGGGSSYTIVGEYKFAEKTDEAWADVLGLTGAAAFYHWGAFVQVQWQAIGGAEVLYLPDHLSGLTDIIASVKVYHTTGGTEGSSESSALSYLADLIYLGSTYGDTLQPTAPTGLDWGEEPSNPYSEPDPPGDDASDFELYWYEVFYNWWAGFDAKMAAYKEKYGEWGEKPGFAWEDWTEATTHRTYYGGLIRFNFTYGNAYVPVGFPDMDLEVCPIISYTIPVAPTAPCDACDSCDADTCQNCDTDACPTCDGEESCDTCNTCESCDTCESDSCDTCDTCEECDVCETCDGNHDGCETCDEQDNCDVCDNCEGCDACDTCNSCEVCNSCDTCEECDTCNACESCESCEGCEVCEGGCDTCDSADSCPTCDGDSCGMCDGGDSIL